MSDPERIDRIVDLLRETWHLNPDYRLGQVLWYAVGTLETFYITDETWEEMLRERLEGETTA